MYPKRIPPKETKSPMRMAGTAEPGTSVGFLIMTPMVRGSCQFYGEGKGKREARDCKESFFEELLSVRRDEEEHGEDIRGLYLGSREGLRS